MAPSLPGLQRWLRCLIGPHGEHPKCDYREHWIAFTRRMSLLRNADDIGGVLAEDLARVSGGTSVGVYLMDAAQGAYRLSASAGSARFVRSIDRAAPVASWLHVNDAPAPLPSGLLPCVTAPALPAALVVAIRWGTMPLGFIVLGPPPTGRSDTLEDLQFLATVAAQAAASIAAVRLSEAAAQPRHIETASVIHDIKNSVSALSLLARNAASNFSDPDFQRDAMVTLSRTVERMRRLLVKLSSPYAEAPRAEPINLQELIIEATTPLAAGGRVRLVRQLGPVNAVYGDRDALLRVVENLTTNAAEAIDHEGTVTVTLAEEQGHAVISVADTGCGISEEYLERHLFAPFRSTKKDGWGVGLYQTQQAVESQDGEILVKSEEGHGTTFTVKLPLRADVDSPSLETVR